MFSKEKKTKNIFLKIFLCNLNNLETSSSNLNTEAELNCTRWTPLIHICSIERGTFFSREFYVTQGCYNIKLIWEYTIKGAVYWWILKKKVINQKVYHNFRVKILSFFFLKVLINKKKYINNIGLVHSTAKPTNLLI